MFDIHSHFLPKLDDGSKSVEESVTMLKESYRQGVTDIAATPHFYPSVHNPKQWFVARDHSVRRLIPYLTEDMPDIWLGAEVHYYDGIYRSEEILDFRIEDTELLLLEMPETKWTSRMQDIILKLNDRKGIKVMLAHIERYFRFQDTDTWNYLRENGILMQVSAEYFIRLMSRRKAINMFKNGDIDMIGSDCHNMESRPPNFGTAVSIIEKHLGRGGVRTLHRREKRALYGPKK